MNNEPHETSPGKEDEGNREGPTHTPPALDYDGPPLSERAAAALRATYAPKDDASTVWL